MTGISKQLANSWALLPIRADEPHILLGKHHLKPEEAVQAALALQVDWVVPCHFGTFRLALEPLDAALPHFRPSATAASLQWIMPTKPITRPPPVISQRLLQNTQGKEFR